MQETDRAAEAAGMAAVSLPDGAASKWHQNYAADFNGKFAVILPDNDQQGLAYAQRVAEGLHGIAQGVVVLAPFADVPEHGDVVDWLDRGGTVQTFANLVAKAPLWLRPMPAGLAPDQRFLIASENGAELLARHIEKPKSILGDGILTEAGFLLFFGRPGIRKTWAAGFQLAIAVARGEPWFGWPTSMTRVGILELELFEYYTQERLRIVAGNNTAGLDEIEIVGRPRLRGPVNLLDDAQRIGIAHWCRERGLGVVIVDALSRVHEEDENSAKELGRVLGAIDQLREDAGCAVVLLHHEPKARERGRGGNTPEDHLDAARGSSRLQSDPQTLLRLHRTRGMLAITAAKVNQGPLPSPIYLKPTNEGPLELTEAPPDSEQLGEENQAEVIAACPPPGEEGALVSEIVAQVERPGLKASTIRAHLSKGAAEGRLTRIKEGKRYRYRRTSEATDDD